ncbi:caffeic acid 3-O-methyltransferase-like [Eucalyptus grandis]|uniref:caffeic acid 3-O-methyltransferase-like n=1 Tax=Eucalyptus grandis TaxID=71139 RepID=UPI00192EC52E|nr:caffeic acid 3-O-methyltransferase-like [Eucalyptus grandis]
MSLDETLAVTTAQEDEEYLFAFKQNMISCFPLVLKATIELGILKLLFESSAQLSPTQIASRLSIKNPDAGGTIDRILRLLASFSFLSCTLTQDKAGRPERMFYLKDAVIQGEGDPFKLVNDATLFDYTGTDPRYNNHFNNSMKCLEHVGGSFVDDPIPKGDILLAKWQFHSFTDEFVIQLLKKCWNALPASGKVVIIDPVSPEYPGTDLVTRATFTSDMVMLALPPGGKDRTLREVEVVARAAGFSSPKVGCQVLNMWALELYKTA